MNVFHLHRQIIKDYETYIQSFINIDDDRIRDYVSRELLSKNIIPEPLIQFNPSFVIGGSVEQLVKNIPLNENLKDCFKGWELFQHQREAIEIGCRNDSFVVTSGTGSGKSLTYIASIFNRIFNEGIDQPGVKAVIVYPMNALINSQHNALLDISNSFKENTKRDFPITFGKFSGQESETERQILRDTPPHILLTNYMMLELILTRAKEERLISALYNNLQFLVFDELHTYRGRQGADVALLIRRIKAQCRNKKIVCIGTSATMASGEGTIKNQREEVSQIATKIFGQEIPWNNVITETLRISFPGEEVSAEELKKSILAPINTTGTEDELKASAFARWLEKNICLTVLEEKWIRARPLTINEIIEKTVSFTGLEKVTCAKALEDLLLWADRINGAIHNLRPRRSYLPYKVHQFIAQTGSVYVTLEEPDQRQITLEAKNKTAETEGSIPLYQLVFSRYSGYEYICVQKNENTSKLEPVPFNSGRFQDDDDEQDTSTGYIIIDRNSDDPVWNPETDMDYLPDSWFNVSKSERRSIKKDCLNKIPQEIYFNSNGDYSATPKINYIKGWFMQAPLAFDPTSQTTFEGGNPREANKLARLGIEGRSTATTILSYLTIKELARQISDPRYQKLLCFTDVRQDAALQAGHFNDFIKVGVLRSAIYKALEINRQLTYRNVDIEVFRTLALKQDDYSQVPADPGSFQYSENEKALKVYLYYRVLYDLRRGWRVILPNLEQVALLKIDYQNLMEEAQKEKWDILTGFNSFTPQQRYGILFQTLEFFRTSFASHFSIYDQHEVNKRIINNNLKEPWTLDQNEKLYEPFYLRIYKPQQKKQNVHTLSIAAQSGFGKYLKSQFKLTGIKEIKEIKGERLNEWIYELLNLLCQSGYLRKRENLLDQDLYQLNGTNIIWLPGDKSTTWQDKVRIRTGKHTEIKLNKFFQDFYLQDFRSIKPILAAEHTGQIENDEREKYEKAFNNGDISALYCSSTMELGVDISELNVVQLRNVPPNPANYSQRSGRAGRSGQAALVLTYCANTSSHDRHYFEHRIDMVSGNVIPPKLDLTQEELIQTHLNALFLSRTSLGSLNDSVYDILDMDIDPVKMPLKQDSINALRLEENVYQELESIFAKAISDIIPDIKSMPSIWFTEDWISRKLKQAPELFDRSLDRWREIFRRCVEQLMNAGQVLSDPRIPRTDERKKAAERERQYADRQIELLRNDKKGTRGNQLSEFYPYRYLADEGFLPGYGFTKLPVRLFVPKDDGKYISRPKFIALREFGPQNTVYHSGGKYRVNQMLWSETDNPLVQAKIAKGSGYILLGADARRNICPITGADLSDNSKRLNIANMLEIRESRSEVLERITCEEEERNIRGYDITTCFYLQSGLDRVEEVLVKVENEILLRMQYLPAARIVQINNKWRISKEGEGYYIGKKTGFWKKPAQMENRPANAEEIERVRLYAENTADALYIQPTKNLNLNPFEAGVVTLMYALKRAFENVFQVESNEMDVWLMGTSEEPNILLYESAEGSMGVISQFVKNVIYFRRLINEAYDLCHFNLPEVDQEKYGTASYGDLLSFFNQRNHNIIDRYLIKGTLEVLMNAQVEIKRSSLYADYENQYQELLKRIDPTSSTELKFIQYLYKNNLRLPDRAQVNMAEYGCYTIPDFVYTEEVKVCVFCDGTPHDQTSVAESDEIKRTCLENLGFEVLVWHYLTPLDEFVTKRQDIFKKVKE